MKDLKFVLIGLTVGLIATFTMLSFMFVDGGLIWIFQEKKKLS